MTNDSDPLTNLNTFADELVRRNQAADDAVRPGILWHYTTTPGLMSIVESRSLRASDARFLNDSTELAIGATLLTEVRDEMLAAATNKGDRLFIEQATKHAHPDEQELRVLVACFCQDGDLLSQWRGYGNLGGYSLGFDSAFGVELAPDELKALGPGPGVSLLKVVYDSKKTKARMLETLWGFLKLVRQFYSDSKLTTDVLAHAITQCSGVLSIHYLSAKHHSFSEEKEWRAIVLVNEEDAASLLSVRTSDTLLIPFFPLKLRSPGQTAAPLPLKQITIGPTVKDHRARDSVEFFLAKNDHVGVVVANSAIPLL